ncbi:MAG: sodium/proton-translocating pyrophosphatase, partial [Candidatus Omnitrophota bacterium]
MTSTVFTPFAFMNDPVFTVMEKFALWSVLGVAILGLMYAVFLMMQVLRFDKGTPKMQEISKAIRLGSNAYLSRQFKAIVFLVFILTAALYFTAGEAHIQVGRACAFLMGAFFSAMVGFVGMNLA